MTWLLVNCYGIRRAIKHFGVGWYRKIIHSNAALRITAHSKGFYSLLILQLYNNLYSIHSLDLYTQKTTPQHLIKYKPKANCVFVCVFVSLEYEVYHVSPVNPGLCCWLTSGLCGTEAEPRPHLSLHCLLLTAYNTGLMQVQDLECHVLTLLHIRNVIQTKSIKQQRHPSKKTKTNRGTSSVHLQPDKLIISTWLDRKRKRLQCVCMCVCVCVYT